MVVVTSSLPYKKIISNTRLNSTDSPGLLRHRSSSRHLLDHLHTGIGELRNVYCLEEEIWCRGLPFCVYPSPAEWPIDTVSLNIKMVRDTNLWTTTQTYPSSSMALETPQIPYLPRKEWLFYWLCKGPPPNWLSTWKQTSPLRGCCLCLLRRPQCERLRFILPPFEVDRLHPPNDL